MTEIVVYLLVCFGLIYTVTESVVFARVRIAIAASGGPLRMVMMYCASCVGFWVGVGAYLLMLAPRPWTGWSPLCGIGAGFLVMGVISVVRAFAPDFLPGAYERERDIVERIRSGREAQAGAEERARRASRGDSGGDDFDR